jgi:uncharacterized protein
MQQVLKDTTLVKPLCYFRSEFKLISYLMNFRKEPFLAKYSNAQQILLLMMLAILCMVVFSAIGVFGAIGFYNVNIFTNPEVLKNASDPNVLAALQMMQTMQAIGFFVVPSIGFAALAANNKWEYLAVNNLPKLLPFLVAVIMVAVSIPFINYMGEWNSKLPFPQWVYDSEKEAEVLMQAFLNFDTVGALLFNLFMMALLPAIGEEFLFRGLIQKLIHNISNNKHVAVWCSAIIFSAFHMQFLGFFPRMILGAMFGYMVIESGNLWYSIAGHFTNNAMAVIITYFINTKQILPDVETYGVGNFTISMLSALAMVAAMALFGKLIIAKQKNNHQQN